MKVSIMFPSKFVCAADLNGKPINKTIKGVKGEDLRMEDGSKERKYLLYFSDAKKPLVLNKTNAHLIAGMYGGESDAWAGKPITLYPTTCSCFGETVDCIRIKDKPPTPKDAEPDHDPTTGEVAGEPEPDAGSNG